MYSKLALVMTATVGSAALAFAQTPSPTDSGVRYYRTPGVVATTPAAAPAEQEASSVPVTSTPRSQSTSGSMGGMMGGQSTSGGMGGMMGGQNLGGGMGGMGVFGQGGSSSGSNNLGGMWRGGRGAVYFAEDATIARETDQLIRQLGEARSDSDRDKLKAKLSELLEKQFEQRQKRHEGEIADLEAQVKKLKDLVSKRQENRREIITRRLEQIVRESQGLGW